MKSILTEIIRKECEAYRLIDRGWLHSVEEGVGAIYSFASDNLSGELADKEEFLVWRKHILLHFYRSVGFTADESFLFDVKQKVLSSYRENYRGQTIDNDLAIPPHTVAFKLSPKMAKIQYHEEETTVGMMRTPAEIEQYCQLRCAIFFPLELEGFLFRIKLEDAVFGEELLRLIRVISRKMMSYIDISIQYKEEIMQDTWSDTYLFVTEKIKSDTLPPMESSLHLRHYIGNVCRNKAFEARRTNQLPGMMEVGDDFWEQLSETLVQEPSVSILFDEVDINNKDEVNRALTIILLDRVEPWFGRLTKGVEEQTVLLLDHYADGKSYEEIVCGEKGYLNIFERKRRENNLRQTVSRTRRLLRERFVQLLKQKQNRYSL